MGVHGLWRILEPAEEVVRLPQLEGHTIGIDLAIWMCHDMTVKYNSAVTLKLYVRNLFFRIVSLLLNGALPVGVCDGPAPALKLHTMQQRQKKNGSKVTTSTKRTHFRRIAKECCSLLELLGVPHLESPGEAESMCAHLNSNGWTDACLTADGDAFLYGAETVYSALSLAQGDAGVSVFRADRIRAKLGLDRGRLVALGLLLGCDFIGSAKGVGPKRALTWLNGLSREVDLLTALREASQPETLDLLSASDARIVSEMLLRLESHYEEVIDEFRANVSWKLPRDHFSWKRPQPLQLITFCVKHLDWEEDYALHKILPLVAAWDVRHPRILTQPSLRPSRIIRKRQVKFVPSFEVEWAKFDFDNWSTEESYVFSVPQHPFASVHVDLVADLECAAAKKGKKKEAKKDEKRSKTKEGKERKVKKEEGEKKEKEEKKEEEEEKEKEREFRHRMWDEDEGGDSLVGRLARRLEAVSLPTPDVTKAFRVTAWTPSQAQMDMKLSSLLLSPEGDLSKPSYPHEDLPKPSVPLDDLTRPCVPLDDLKRPSVSPDDPHLDDSPLPLLQRLARRKRL